MAELLRAADLSRPVARVLAYRVPSNGLLEAAIVELEGGHVAALATLRVVGRSERRTPVSLERPSLNALGDALAQPRHYSRFVGFSELLSSAAKTASARARPSRGRRIVDGSRDWWRYVDKGAVVSAVILLVVLSVGGVAFYVEHRRGSARDAVLKSLEGGMATYLRTLKARDAPDKHARYFRGQGVVLTRSQFEPKNSDDFIRHENAGEPRVASLHFKLPDELRAERPEAVSTVVWLECEPDEVGTYSNGLPALEFSCDVMLVDATVPTTLDRRSFVGGEPPEVIRGSQPRTWGDLPVAAILEYLERLPRKR